MSFFSKLFKSREQTKDNGDKQALLAESILSPVEGDVIPLAEIDDEAFASGALGAGIAIRPTVGRLYAPADGEITTFFPTGHAIGMKTKGGAELLIHVGMDTVRMDGDGFTPVKKQNETVKKGDLLLEFDLTKIKAAGLSEMTPVVVTNSEDYTSVLPTEQKTVHPGDVLLELAP